jgi:hypothetical protein
MTRVKVSVEFGYKASTVIECNDDVFTTAEERTEEVKKELLQELNCDFGTEGELTNFIVEIQEISGESEGK